MRVRLTSCPAGLFTHSGTHMFRRSGKGPVVLLTCSAANVRVRLTGRRHLGVTLDSSGWTESHGPYGNYAIDHCSSSWLFHTWAHPRDHASHRCTAPLHAEGCALTCNGPWLATACKLPVPLGPKDLLSRQKAVQRHSAGRSHTHCIRLPPPVRHQPCTPARRLM